MVQIGHLFAAHGVRGALLAQPNSSYADDNRWLLSPIAGSGGRYRGIAVVAHDASVEDLARLKAQGIIGVAFNLPFQGTGHYIGTEALIERMVDLDLFLQICVGR